MRWRPPNFVRPICPAKTASSSSSSSAKSGTCFSTSGLQAMSHLVVLWILRRPLPRQDLRGAQRPSRQGGESVATSEPGQTPNRHGRRLDLINRKFRLKSSTLMYRRNGRNRHNRQKFVRLLQRGPVNG